MPWAPIEIPRGYRDAARWRLSPASKVNDALGVRRLAARGAARAGRVRSRGDLDLTHMVGSVIGFRAREPPRSSELQATGAPTGGLLARRISSIAVELAPRTAPSRRARRSPPTAPRSRRSAACTARRAGSTAGARRSGCAGRILRRAGGGTLRTRGPRSAPPRGSASARARARRAAVPVEEEAIVADAALARGTRASRRTSAASSSGPRTRGRGATRNASWNASSNAGS